MALSEKAEHEKKRRRAVLDDLWADYDTQVIESKTVGAPGKVSPRRQALRDRIQHEVLALHIAESYP